MKKFVALVLALMLCLSLCACGGSGASSPEKAVENAYAKYDNVKDMYEARGIDLEASLKQSLMDMAKGEKLKDIKDEFLDDWPDAFSWRFGDAGDKISSLIGADKLGEYRTDMANAASLEEFVDLFVELYVLYYDTYLGEVRELSYVDDFDDDITVEKVDQISVRELEGKDYNEAYAELAEDFADSGCVYLFELSDVEAIYSVAFVKTYSDSDTDSVDFDDGWYVIETSEGCFIF